MATSTEHRRAATALFVQILEDPTAPHGYYGSPGIPVAVPKGTAEEVTAAICAEVTAATLGAWEVVACLLTYLYAYSEEEPDTLSWLQRAAESLEKRDELRDAVDGCFDGDAG